MTREEAIQWLKHINITDFGWDDYAMQDSQKEIRERCEQSIREAIDMAIEALSEPSVSIQPKTIANSCDLISRADAVKAIVSWESEVADNVPYAREVFEIMAKREHEILNAIERVPSVSADRPTPNYITESPNDVDKNDDEVIDRPIIEHDREWIIGCIKHDGFIKTDRFDKANQIILDALADRQSGEWVNEWKDIDGGRMYGACCSVCHTIGHSGYTYCPNCGARMENTK